MNSAPTRLDRTRLAAAIALVVGVAACGLSVDDLFTAGVGGGAGGAFTTTTSTHSSSHASTSSSTASSSSSGGPVCGDGVCAPGESAHSCPKDCASSSSSSSSGGGACAHPVCDTGNALTASCSACANAICADDPYCCTMSWDDKCVEAADKSCGSCCGNGRCDNTEDCKSCAADCGPCAPPPTCPHSACATGDALQPQKCRDACVAQVCAQKPACCGDGKWDGSCSLLAAQLCGGDTCVTAVCAAIPSCCSSGWTQACVDKAKTTCQTQCNCAHSICQNGGPLTETCNPCAKAICTADPYCCTNSWDDICVDETGSICGISCQ